MVLLNGIAVRALGQGFVMNRDTESTCFVLTLSGSDASGCAGLQADNRAIHAMGAFPLNVVTALTLQTDKGVQSIAITAPELVRMHVVGLLNTYPVAVIKTGMLGNAATISVLVDVLRQYPKIKLVVDPVTQATSGRPLLDEAGLKTLVSDLLPLAYLVTPNLPELKQLTECPEPVSKGIEREAAQQLLARGCQSVLVKGGHRDGDVATDRLYQSSGVDEYSQPFVVSRNTRGTGCALASLIAGRLARGEGLELAIEQSKPALTESIKLQSGVDWGGNGPAFL